MWKPTLFGIPRCLSPAGAQHQPPCSEAKRPSKAAHSPGVSRPPPVPKTSRLRPQPAGAPEATLGARSRLTLPQAPASLSQSAAWAALAPRPYRACFRHRPPPLPCARLQLSWG